MRHKIKGGRGARAQQAPVGKAPNIASRPRWKLSNAKKKLVLQSFSLVPIVNLYFLFNKTFVTIFLFTVPFFYFEKGWSSKGVILFMLIGLYIKILAYLYHLNSLNILSLWLWFRKFLLGWNWYSLHNFYFSLFFIFHLCDFGFHVKIFIFYRFIIFI